MRKISWILAIFTYGFLDIYLTFTGFYLGINEYNFIPLLILNSTGIIGLFLWKWIVIFGFYKLYQIIPNNYNIGIPIGLFIVGITFSFWNIFVISQYLR